MMYTLKELILDGRETKAKALLIAGRFPPADLIKRDAYRSTPLHWAIKCHCYELAALLLSQGAGCCKGMRDLQGATPFDLAIQAGAPAELLSLLDPNPHRIHYAHPFMCYTEKLVTG